MTLDVVIPTYNRVHLLLKTLGSFEHAAVPPGLSVTLFVVDNNCTDGTADAVHTAAARSPLPIQLVRETRQGLSNARNAGIAAGTGDLVAFIDDDEEVEPHWLTVIAREFKDAELDFIGGPYLPNWVTPVPPWLPPGYHSVIGAIPPKPRGAFGSPAAGNLMGGNAVLRRSVFDRVGLYNPRLGRSGKGLLSDEDADMLRRLLAAGLRGTYVPDLAIRHYIAPERLTRGYHRRWVYWRAASQGVLHRTDPDPAVRTLFGVERYRFGQALRSLVHVPLLRARGRPAEGFSSELDLWDLAGFIHGRHFLDVESMYRR